MQNVKYVVGFKTEKEEVKIMLKNISNLLESSQYF